MEYVYLLYYGSEDETVEFVQHVFRSREQAAAWRLILVDEYRDNSIPGADATVWWYDKGRDEWTDGYQFFRIEKEEVL